jgi:hypothetical protein
MSRIGGAFPFPTAQVNEGGGIITLPSGGTFYLPSGEWVCYSGVVSCLQSFDPINQLWRGLQEPTLQAQMVSSDGFNYRLINMSGVVAGALITNAGSGGTNGIGSVATGTTVTFTAPVSAQVNQTATGYAIVGGSVQAPTIAQAGSGFISAPLIVIDAPPPGGIQATAIATINAAGGISGITMVNVGAGYAASPNFWIIPQFGLYAGGLSGSFAAGATPAPGLVFPSNAAPGNQNTSAVGAQLTSQALTGSGTLTGIVTVDPGNLYDGTHIPTVTIAGTVTGGVAATAIMSFSLQSVTVTNAGAGYGAGNPPIFETSLGSVAAATNNGVFVPRSGRGIAVVAGGSVSSFTVEDPGFGLQKVPFVSVLDTSADNATLATGTAVVGGINDTSVLQPRVQ